MAQTWPPRKWKRVLLAAVDSVARPIARRLYKKQLPPIPASPRILVVELWQIGDVILSTPFLAALRYCFPDSTITFLGKRHAETLLRASGLADDVIVAELPWTRPERKYNPADYDWGVLRDLLRRLRRRRFDVVFDARMDIRSNILVSLVGAKRRFGFRYGGGDWLLTDAVTIDPSANHKTGDWACLLRAAGCQPAVDPSCTLKTTDEERAAARAVLSNHFGGVDRPIALHPGGSHAGKRWPLDRFDSLARELLGGGYQVVAFQEPNGYGKELDGIAGVFGLCVGLREMMAIIEQCATLVCNDSGPMHVAAALGVPTVAIFERGEPRWFGPVGAEHVIIAGEKAGIDVSAAPLDRPPANPVPVGRVKEAVLKQVERSRSSRYSQTLEAKI